MINFSSNNLFQLNDPYTRFENPDLDHLDKTTEHT